jgi:NAD+ synthase
MGKELGVNQDIIDAAPTDGLWDDARTDEKQLGMTYPELEQAMMHSEQDTKPTDTKELKNLMKFLSIQKRAKHKMEPIPVCKLGEQE